MASSFEGGTCQRATESAEQARTGSHMETYLLIFGVQTENSKEYGSWAAAKRDQICKQEAAEKEAKSAEEQAKRRAQKEQDERVEAQRQAALKQRLDEEVRTGRCSDKSAGHLRRILGGASQVFSSSATGEVWQPVGHRLEVATNDPVVLTIDAGLGGEVHVFAVGYSKTTLSVSDGQGYDVKDHSPWEDAFWTAFGMRAEGIQARTNVHERLAAKVRGKGCVLVFAMQKF